MKILAPLYESTNDKLSRRFSNHDLVFKQQLYSAADEEVRYMKMVEMVTGTVELGLCHTLFFDASYT